MSSKLAAEYDTKYEKTILQLEKEIRKRKDFIGAGWVTDDDDDDDDDDSESESAAQSTAANGRSVRLLDYACGTGLISRVSCFSTFFPIVFSSSFEDDMIMF